VKLRQGFIVSSVPLPIIRVSPIGHACCFVGEDSLPPVGRSCSNISHHRHRAFSTGCQAAVLSLKWPVYHFVIKLVGFTITGFPPLVAVPVLGIKETFRRTGLVPKLYGQNHWLLSAQKHCRCGTCNALLLQPWDSKPGFLIRTPAIAPHIRGFPVP